MQTAHGSSSVVRQILEETRQKVWQARAVYLAEPCADICDDATHQEQIYLTNSLMNREQERLRVLEHLSACPDGPRMCLDCGDPISFQRIRANPEALRCVACQEEWEDSDGIHLSRSKQHAGIGQSSGFAK